MPVLALPRLSLNSNLVLKLVRVDGQGDQAQPVTQHLVVDDARVVDHEDVLNSHGRGLADDDAPKSVGELQMVRREVADQSSAHHRARSTAWAFSSRGPFPAYAPASLAGSGLSAKPHLSQNKTHRQADALHVKSHLHVLVVHNLNVKPAAKPVHVKSGGIAAGHKLHFRQAALRLHERTGEVRLRDGTSDHARLLDESKRRTYKLMSGPQIIRVRCMLVWSAWAGAVPEAPALPAPAWVFAMAAIRSRRADCEPKIGFTQCSNF